MKEGGLEKERENARTTRKIRWAAAQTIALRVLQQHNLFMHSLRLISPGLSPFFYRIVSISPSLLLLSRAHLTSYPKVHGKTLWSFITTRFSSFYIFLLYNQSFPSPSLQVSGR